MLKQISSSIRGWNGDKPLGIEHNIQRKKLLKCNFDGQEIILVFEDCFVYVIAEADGDCCEPSGYFRDCKFNLDFREEKNYTHTPEPMLGHVDLGIITKEELIEYQQKRQEYVEERDKQEKLDKFNALKAELQL